MKESLDAQQCANNVFLDKGFLQTAFTESERGLIADTTIYDTEDSTTDSTNSLPKADHKFVGWYITDKVFLLSQKEATMSEYGFDAYDVGDDSENNLRDSVRERENKRYGYCSYWILRSPISKFESSYEDEYGAYGDYVQCVQYGKTGVLDAYEFRKVACRVPVGIYSACGVVPALCVSK